MTALRPPPTRAQSGHHRGRPTLALGIGVNTALLNNIGVRCGPALPGARATRDAVGKRSGQRGGAIARVAADLHRLARAASVPALVIDGSHGLQPVTADGPERQTSRLVGRLRNAGPRRCSAGCSSPRKINLEGPRVAILSHARGRRGSVEVRVLGQTLTVDTYGRRRTRSLA
jgi:hypothetical protein